MQAILHWLPKLKSACCLETNITQLERNGCRLSIFVFWASVPYMKWSYISQRSLMFSATLMRDVTKAEFLTVWAPAYLEAFNKSTVHAAFKVTGIVPFNPNFITKEQMKPSLATSTGGEFPLPQPSPFCAITNAVCLHPATRFDLPPSNITSSSTLPQTPSRRRSWDEIENINPVLWSPSKKMRTLYAHLGNTSTGSLLLSSPKIKSYDTSIHAPVIQHVPRAVETPNWTLSSPDTAGMAYKTRGQLEAENDELQRQLKLVHLNVTVRDNILEETNATMVLQNVGLKKMKEVLHQQEEKAVTDRAQLFKGRAQCLSNGEFADQGEGGGLEKEWARMRERRAAEAEAWSKTCSTLLTAKTKKKDLPPKPKLGKKPQLPVEENVEEDYEDDVEEEVMDETDM
ncbi:hypothetical protein C8R47DRAFT_1083368 [Mycena vitilis]|nr:hypothetical protein C8R47DRAFT_1083368 [Mycena vitilis]